MPCPPRILGSTFYDPMLTIFAVVPTVTRVADLASISHSTYFHLASCFLDGAERPRPPGRGQVLVWHATLSVGVGVCAGGVGRVLELTHSPSGSCREAAVWWRGAGPPPGSFGSGLAVCSHLIHPTVSLYVTVLRDEVLSGLGRSPSVGTCSRALS